ncbi:MAG: InlB B-repeat-containing protein [Kiritimatiellae bacterium]|nr:InlB B-repeat-containing protein [Kiritimatiellia bacterium]
MAETTWFVNARHGSNGYSGLSTFAPKRTIQAAINAASSGDYIIVSGGTYNENLTLSKRLTLFSHESAVTIVDGRHAGHCLLITENAAGSVVDGIVFTHGAPTNAGNKYGGGVDCLANATIRHCVFKDNGNSSTTFAGGLHTANRAQVTIENCLFTGNYAWACGGASLTEGGSTATFDRCTIYGNRSDDFIGNQGGIGVANTGTVIVKNSILWGNTGNQIAAYGSSYGAQSTIRVSYSCVQGGVAANGAGHFYNDGGNISSNPLFINVARRNFWFRDNSPCWRMGHPDFYERDGYRLHMGFWPSRVRIPPPPVWQVEITLDAQGGDSSTDLIKRNVNDKVGRLPEPQRDGFDFLGWFDKAEGGRRIFPEERVSSNRTFYAQWKERIPPLFEVVGRTSGITSLVQLNYRLEDGARDGKLYVNGELLTSTEEESSGWTWQPQTLGANTIVYETGHSSITTTVNVAGLSFYTVPAPNPPMAVDDGILITPTVRTIPEGGAGKAILVQGGAWTAATSDPWIVLGATSGTADEPVAYSVSVNTNIGERVGYVYVSGHVHTITQKGRSAELSPENIEVECEGGSESIGLTFDGRYAWDARPNVDWITVTPTHGTSSGTIDCTIAPYNEVGTRTGTITFGDRTVTVFQYGRRIKLSDEHLERDYYTHVMPITVNALAITEWSATPNASWISIVEANNAQGRLAMAISENPSYRARTGTVTVGTETFTVTQAGRPASACAFAIDPVETTASVNGANGHIAVTATPDLPWTVASSNGWLALLQSTAVGDGNGNVFYTASPNSTLLERTGTIVVTPSDPYFAPYVHTVVQPGAVATLSPAGYEFEASGGSVSVTVTVPGSVEWTAVEAPAWITVQGGAAPHVGSGSVTLQATPNGTINARSGTVKIAERLFAVAQKGRGFTVNCDDGLVFSTDGGMDSFSVYPDGDMAWEAYASDPWITFMYGSNVGSGAGEVIYVVAPYVGDGAIRTGSITIGDKEILVSQRAYDLSISPRAAEVSGNSGAGEISVSAGKDDVWHAIRTEPWIIIEQGYDSGTGSGTVRFTYTDNDTGLTRSGKIVIDGEVYTLTQASRVLVDISAQVYGHGHVDGAGTHPLGTRVTLTAVPDDGYVFQYWTGAAGNTMQNPITLTADVAKSVTATFTPLTPEFISAQSTTEGVQLTWTNLAWAAEYRIYRAPSSEIPSAPLVTLAADGNCTYLDTTGDEEQPFWYWVEAVGTDAQTESQTPVTGKKLKPIVISPITYENLRGASHVNPSTYQEGTTCAFTPPTAVPGYTFAGWDPAGISADLTGEINIRATWTANTYTLVYHANGGSGTMDATLCTYDSDALVGTNRFVWIDHIFQGWATNENGAVVYEDGAYVRNLSAAQSGVVELYAVWEIDPESLAVAEPVITPADGATFKTDTCTVTITCETPNAVIYYTTNGRTPTAADRYRYTGPFTISGTATITAFAYVDESRQSDYVEATITYVEPVPLTWKGVLDEPKLATVATGGDAEWLMTESDEAKVGDSFAVSGEVTDDDETEHTTSLKATVSGKGTLTFWWRVDCEPDPRGRFTYDHGKVEADGALVDRKDGQTGWLSGSVTFNTDGDHEITWTYVADGYPAEGGSYAGRMLVDGCSWSGGSPSSATEPEIEGDPTATVSGDATNGYTITPSAGTTNVTVSIPSGLDPSKVTVEVNVNVAIVIHNGANVKVVNHGHDITSFLDIPSTGGTQFIASATIKPAIAREPLDPAKGAVINLTNPAAPSLTTPATRPGLTYTLREGRTLTGMSDGAVKQGDGQPWTPPITVKGGTSGFYSIKVTK